MKGGAIRMAQRNLLHKSKREAFVQWFEQEGWKIYDTVGYYEVIRAKKGERWLIAYRRAEAKEHYSLLDKDCPLFRRFLKSQKERSV